MKSSLDSKFITFWYSIKTYPRHNHGKGKLPMLPQMSFQDALLALLGFFGSHC